MEITKDKVTELFCIIDEFYKVFDAENAGKLLLGEDGVKRRRRKASLSDSKIMTILLYSISARSETSSIITYSLLEEL